MPHTTSVAHIGHLRQDQKGWYTRKMRVGIVPTKHGYNAVVLPPFDSDWRLESPVVIPRDARTQLRGQILHALANYKQTVQLPPLPIILAWAAWGTAALYLRLAYYWENAPRFVFLYGWIMFFFFGDGLFMLTRWLFNLRHTRHTRKIGKIKVDTPWQHEARDWHDIRGTAQLGERAFIDTMIARYPDAAPFYREMLREEPALFLSMIPLGLVGMIKWLFLGPKFYRPALVFDLGKLHG